LRFIKFQRLASDKVDLSNNPILFMNLLTAQHLFILADSHHFVLLERDPHKKKDHLRIVTRIEFDPEQYESQKRDNPGKSISRARGGHTAYGYSDLPVLADRHYLSDACKSVEPIFQKGNFQDVVLIAESKFMHEIKHHLSATIRERIKHEVHKNYAKLPIAELEQQLIRSA
jgi:protein required for attachment to host cells